MAKGVLRQTSVTGASARRKGAPNPVKVPQNGSVNISRAENGVVVTVSDYDKAKKSDSWFSSESRYVFNTPGEIEME